EESKRTPLHQAVIMGRIEVVEELLRHSECARFIDLGDINDRAAIHEAAARGHIDTLQMLLHSGAQVDVHDKMGMTPLHLA
ncbi:ankyrin repeat protein, partial [Podospora didyma]